MFFDVSRKKGVERRNLKSVPRPPEPIDYMTVEEFAQTIGQTLVLDIECFPNYLLVAFKSLATGKVCIFELSPEAELDIDRLSWLMCANRTVSFNGSRYDIPIISAIVRCFVLLPEDTLWFKHLSDKIILEEMTPEQLGRDSGIEIQRYNHIDLFDVAPLQASLKKYAGRMHAKRLQDLPYNPNKNLTRDEAAFVKAYCVTDLNNTEMLFNELKEQISLRESLSIQYEQDLRSKSDAQIAEAVITSEHKKLTGYYPKRATFAEGDSFSYIAPAYCVFSTPELTKALETVSAASFVLDANGSPRCEAMQELTVRVGPNEYAMGIGGLHSREKCRAIVADEQYAVVDIDVASYYPTLILNAEIKPAGMAKTFTNIYRSVVERRLKAKREGNKVEADSLKITANGTFGKLGSHYSAMYSPQGMIQVTLTGQLAILLLIEKLHLANFEVCSGNTDGVIVRYHRNNKQILDRVVSEWCALTGLTTEEKPYRALYNRDVNNYIAIGTDGKVKVKGCYAEVGSTGNSRLSKNPENLICSDAVIALLTKAKPLKETIEKCTDITRFVTVRDVKGGGEKDGVYLGKVVRYYYAKGERGTINYIASGNKVPNSDGARPIMDLPDDFPADIDFDKYCSIALNMLSDIGYSTPIGCLF